MARDGNGKMKLWSLVITLALIFASIVGTWAVYGKDIEDNSDDIAELKVEGCKPSGKLVTKMAVVETNIAAIQDDMKEMRQEQKVGLKQILEAVSKKP